MAHTPSVDEQNYIERVINASALKGLMDDPRWNFIVSLVVRLRSAADNKARVHRRGAGFDGMVKANYYDGQVAFADMLMQTFLSVYKLSEHMLDEAKKTLPYAPAPPGKPEGIQSAPPEGQPQGEKNA
ncbi:MAG: hypothetical protein ACREBU_11435 [Nitrososphaera sp.]